jgi:hypothetical protein
VIEMTKIKFFLGLSLLISCLIISPNFTYANKGEESLILTNETYDLGYLIKEFRTSVGDTKYIHITIPEIFHKEIEASNNSNLRAKKELALYYNLNNLINEFEFLTNKHLDKGEYELSIDKQYEKKFNNDLKSIEEYIALKKKENLIENKYKIVHSEKEKDTERSNLIELEKERSGELTVLLIFTFIILIIITLTSSFLLYKQISNRR